MLSAKTGKAVSTEVQFDMQTKLNLITEHTIKDKNFKFCKYQMKSTPYFTRKVHHFI